MPRLDAAHPPARVAVFRALQLGDMLCVVPALRALRAHLPGTRITLIGLPWAAEFAARFAHYVDDFIAFPGAWGFPEQAPDIDALPAFLHAVNARRFDVLVQLHGSGGLSNGVVADFGARTVIGHAPADIVEPPDGFLRWREPHREILRWLELLAACGVPPRGTALEFPLDAADRIELERLLARYRIDPARLVCVHPGARLPSRRWDPARFAQVADTLVDAGFTIVLTGSAGERPLTAAVRAAMRAPALDLAGATALGVLAALIGAARLLIANDTGVSHIAAALRTPSVIVSSGGDARRWAPLDRRLHRVLHYPVPCRPCAHDACPLLHHACALGVTVETVQRQTTMLLQEMGTRAA